MSIIEVDNISKAYRIGATRPGKTSFKETLTGMARVPFARLKRLSENFDEPDTFWALKDVSFKIEAGESVGIIGRNGAGKSTMLKVLSRITEPTKGQAVMHGRVSSLLEVGTGFHPELTGRENVFLNGAILGMSRAEIRTKFDDIVEFSEIGKFLDTPVKRYSSGMYVRLAFSVAAHLDPQIMIVDEVLAVGDAAFQKKCLGKMNDVVSKQGRTILFVSHSMDAVASLCKSAILFKAGQASEKMPVDEGVRRYLEQTSGDDVLPLEKKSRIQLRDRSPIFHHLTIRHDGSETTILPTASDIEFEIGLQNFSDEPGSLTCGVGLTNERGQRVALFHSLYHSDMTFKGSDSLTLRCRVPSLPLTPGRYNVELVIANGFDIIEKVERAAVLDVVFADVFGTGKIPTYHQSVMVLPAEWKQV